MLNFKLKNLKLQKRRIFKNDVVLIYRGILLILKTNKKLIKKAIL
jgi:hypothetical protein